MKRLINTRLILTILLASVVAFAVGYIVRGTGHQPATSLLDEHAGHGLEASVDEGGNIIWTCSMHPQIQLPEPGNCPICFMELIPIRRGDDSTATSLRGIEISEEARLLAGIETEPVQRLDVDVERRMVGKVDYDETRVRAITAWTGGRVDRMFVDYTGKEVKQGQAMVSIYSPELLTAQVELIEAHKALEDLKDSKLPLIRNTAQRMVEAAGEKLRLLGLQKSQIEAVVRQGRPSDHITIHAPQGGVVLTKNVNEGQYVTTGSPIYSIADLSVVWVILEAYESDLPWVEIGQQVAFQTEAYPGKTFGGTVVYIDPVVSEKTRTVRVRLEVSNRDRSLKPGMLVRAVRHRDGATAGTSEPRLVIPATAPLITGKRAVVYVQDPQDPGRFEGREIVLGPKAGAHYIVKNGLEEGERVVTRGNFKIDSAVQIIARPSMMSPVGAESKGGGHDHGPRTGQPTASPADSPPGRELPPLFASKARLLDATFRELEGAVVTGDLALTHLAFGVFNKELRLIDGTGLERRAALLWREYAMLLGNDAIIGAEVPDTRRLHQVFAEMKGHYAGFRAAFNLDAPEEALAAPESFQRQLGAVFARYEHLSEALAADDMAGAQAAADAMAEALRKVDMAVLGGPAHNVWMAALARMNDGLAVVREAGDIVAVRTGLEPISVGLAEAIVKLGVQTEGPVFELFCPMAFDYDGATWLQRDESIRNPYMGQAMPTCGETNQQLKQ
ncbi:efflux RND transporter periplasmic adaptor subunit [Pseudodesulfovibrio pelocollis]|uniref:efflux RND transporter periplasmic adaptor subunit n=1 Tax=Pseudodesulfovibrio pelocollis TaxID=3051432 RepID=UPI00255AB7D8|nr:efflux RND transporter periplasmic adaptor subunit [Pseudodesulfovibrio sp. SB368]